jgi:hypothetical protein
MTLIEANQQAADFNNSLGERTSSAKYKSFAFWRPDWLKTYNVVLIPTKYEADFNGASESQKIAFQRVAVKALNLIIDLSTFVSNFDAIGANDEELASYLDL